MFSENIYVDVLTINKEPVVQVVDEATRYQAASWLESVSEKFILRAVSLS